MAQASTLLTSMGVFTEEATARNRLYVNASRNLTVGSGCWESHRWKTKLSRRRCYGFCKACTSRISWASAMVSDLVVASMTHSMR